MPILQMEKLCLKRVREEKTGKGQTSLVVQWLRLCTATEGGMGLNPSQGTINRSHM